MSADIERASKRRLPWLRATLWIHRWSGLVATPFFLVLCMTGSILIFHDEIDVALGDVTRLSDDAPATVAKPFSELVAAVVRPGERVVSVYRDLDTPRRLAVGVAPLGPVTLEAAKTRFVDTLTGRPIAASNRDATLTGFVLKLHAQWFAGFWGELFGGAIALLVLICLISGIAIYAPYVRAIAFGFIRRDRGPRVLQRDLHTSLGAIALGWAIVVTSTGVLLATSTLLFGAYRVGELKAMSSRVSAIPTGTPVDIDLVVRASEAASPTSLARYIVYPGTDYSSDATFTIFLYGTKRYNERVFDVGIVEAASGRVVAIQPLPKILSLIVISEPLHFGDYGGLPLKLVWLAATWATLYITLNGAWLWFTGVVSRVTWQSFDATPSSAHAGNSHAFEHSGHHRAACDSGLVEFAIPLAHADAACARG